MTILVTGSQGLIGANLIPRLREQFDVAEFDIRCSADEDTRDPLALEKEFARRRITGVIHLAAVSRVVWAEQDPVNCERTNVRALHTLLSLSLRQPLPPWVIFASSREVYGRQQSFPVAETTPFAPINTYGQSKVQGEQLVEEARNGGLVANICRLSSVYGWPHDHDTRVAMAFAGAAAHGGSIVLEGAGNVFDFTFVDDVVAGLLTLVEITNTGVSLPAIHFVSGVGTSLGVLAHLAVELAHHPIGLRETAPRTFDVGHFVGDPSRAASLLGWRAQTSVRQGFAKLVERLRAERGHDAAPASLTAPLLASAGQRIARPIEVRG